MTEQEEAIRIANKVLDRPWADPDDEQAILARQLLRHHERFSHLALRWADEKPALQDYDYVWWRPDPTARPYPLMSYEGALYFGEELWKTPKRGQWAGPIPIPKEGGP